MTDIILCGCCGHMGKVIAQTVSGRSDCRIVCGVDKFDDGKCEFPVFGSFEHININGSVIIDFSHPGVLESLLEYVERTHTACVICTTGLSNSQVERLREASKNIPVFYSGNMSVGINLVISLSKLAAKALGEDFDIEVIEKHHNNKLDAPSGTALMIADGISQVKEKEPEYVYDRHSVRRKRRDNEIGIHSIRGGNIVGEHEVIFAGSDEVISIKHMAQSKAVFAAGAINAAKFVCKKTSGMFDMSDMLADLQK